MDENGPLNLIPVPIENGWQLLLSRAAPLSFPTPMLRCVVWYECPVQEPGSYQPTWVCIPKNAREKTGQNPVEVPTSQLCHIVFIDTLTGHYHYPTHFRGVWWYMMIGISWDRHVPAGPETSEPLMAPSTHFVDEFGTFSSSALVLQRGEKSAESGKLEEPSDGLQTWYDAESKLQN